MNERREVGNPDLTEIRCQLLQVYLGLAQFAGKPLDVLKLDLECIQKNIPPGLK